MIGIDNVEPSTDIRARLAEEGAPVLLAFSRGKDSLAAWLALRDAGIDVIPYHLDLIPHLSFVDESIGRYERDFGTRIIRLPHPSFYRWLNNMVFTSPERCGIIEAADPWEYEYTDLLTVLRADLGLSAETWAADGVRACDSPVRRISIIRYGPARTKTHQTSVIWDWQKHEVMDRIETSGLELPADYAMWHRSFDGLDHRFLAPLRRERPADFDRILEWFPLADLELFRCKLECCDGYQPA